MRINRMQQRAPVEAVRGSRRVTRSLVSITTDSVVRLIAKVRIENAELGMIENVEHFCTELERNAFGDLEMFEHGDIKVQAARVIQKIAAGVAKG